MKLLKNLLFNGMVFLLPISIFAQSLPTSVVKGQLVDDQEQPVSYANAVLYNSADSVLAKVEYTNEDGVFVMNNIPVGTYWLQLSFVGFETFNSEPFDLEENKPYDFRQLKLLSAATGLDEVVVTAQRPLLELKSDKLVFNIENSINATGNNAMDLLRKSPGVIVDNNDNITLLGRSGVRVFIDGKPSPMRGDDLVAYLRTLQSTDIDAIEIITNPSSRYEAEGNGGIINIRLKKDKRLGANANLNLTYTQGEEARYNGSLSGNYRNKAFNAFGSFGYYQGTNPNFNHFERLQSGFTLTQENIQQNSLEGFNYRAGMDFFLNKQHTIGFLVSGNQNDSNNDDRNHSEIGRAGVVGIDSTLIGITDRMGENNNFNVNLNYQWEGKDGEKLNIDADYGRFDRDGSEFQTNTYMDPTESIVLSERINRTQSPSLIDIYTFKVDYEKPLWEGKLGVGGKFSYVTTDNNFSWYNIEDAIESLDIDRTNQFIYDENVNAGYVNYSRQFSKAFNFQIGVRAEHTHSTGELTALKETNNESVERDYLDLFPSTSLNFTLSEKHSLQLSYSRRINRPSYQDLNPFQFKLDELTFFQGNPFLQPEYSNVFQIRHSFNYRLNTTLSYSKTSDLITRQTDADFGKKEAFMTMLNLAEQETYSLNISAPVPITKWWSTYTSLTGFIQRNQGDFGEDRVIDLQVETFNIYSQHTFNLPLDIQMELSGWYNSPSIWGGNFEISEIWSIDAGLRKSILDGKGNLKVSFTDIFKTNQWNGISTFGQLTMKGEGGWDSRRVSINFSYLFGNDQVKKARQRKTGLESEKSRAGGNN